MIPTPQPDERQPLLRVAENNNNPPPQLILTMDQAMDRLGYGRFQTCMFIATGLCMMADSLEVLLLSFLTVVLQSSSLSNNDHGSLGNLTSTQSSAISASVFAGGILGALVLGRLADRWGRKPVFVWTAGLLSVFGLLSGLAPTFATLLGGRFAVGVFSVGGMAVPFVTLSEFLPSSHRGNNLLLIEFFWTAGSVVVVALAYFTLGQGDDDDADDDDDDKNLVVYWGSWRLFVILAAVPSVFATLWAVWFVPESPRWLMTTKQDPVRALQVLRDVAVFNGMDPDALFPPNTQLKSESSSSSLSKTTTTATTNDDDSKSSSACFLDLFRKELRRLTLYLWGTWFGFSFLYYGSVITTTVVFANNSSDRVASTSNSYHFDYGALFVSSLAEIVGNIIMVLTVESLGRIKTQVVAYLGGGTTILLLCLLATSSNHNNYKESMVILAFLTRMLMMISTCTTWVSTAELLPTHIRATGQSAANAMARLGGFVCPFIVGQSFRLQDIGIIMFAIAGGTAFCAYNLPETMGRPMGLGDDTTKKTEAAPSKLHHQETAETTASSLA
eukprot:scaffold3079_cov174-Amphora_coffeaeformis.AAC.6